VHLAIRFSLSGNALLLMAAERRAPWLQGLISVNPHWLDGALVHYVEALAGSGRSRSTP